jgi:hypothetical protein
MKLTKGVLVALTIVGAGLVSQGLITGEQLTSIQNIVGMALGGGGITAIGVIGILNAIPKQVVSSAFDKATEKYGEDKVLSFLDNIDTIITAVETLTYKVDQVISVQETQEAQRKKLLG